MDSGKKTNNPQSEKEINAFFEKAEIPYSRSKEDVWEMLEKSIESKTSKKTIFISQRVIFAVAASVLLVAGVFSFLRFFTQKISSPAGQHYTVNLPDGSTVELNAGSTVAYHPYWYANSRDLQLEGEAFFEVEKGKQFSVESTLGKTIVLGTSFNIYSREDAYGVSCVSGTVKVVSDSNEEAILSPGLHAEIGKSGDIIVSKTQESSTNLEWRNNMFKFTAAKLSEVIAEIERQYNVVIYTDSLPDLYYTGYFSKDKNIDEVLILVGKPFGIKFVKTSKNHYRLTQN
jgi:transmembrane sensor